MPNLGVLLHPGLAWKATRCPGVNVWSPSAKSFNCENQDQMTSAFKVLCSSSDLPSHAHRSWNCVETWRQQKWNQKGFFVFGHSVASLSATLPEDGRLVAMVLSNQIFPEHIRDHAVTPILFANKTNSGDASKSILLHLQSCLPVFITQPSIPAHLLAKLLLQKEVVEAAPAPDLWRNKVHLVSSFHWTSRVASRAENHADL